jgi:hypothetical protein
MKISTNQCYEKCLDKRGAPHDAAYSITCGIDGNIYAAGFTLDDFTVVSLTTAGDTNWVYRYNGPGNVSDWANSLVYGADSNIYAAGYSCGSGTWGDFTVISLTTAGDTNWVYRYNGSMNSDDEARSVVYGADENIYTAGITDNGNDDDFTVISLTNTGDTRWVYQHDGSANGSDYAHSLVYGADGNIYAAGYSYNSGTWDDFTVISLPPNLGAVEENSVVLKNTRNASILSGPLQLPKNKTCRIYNITGRAVMPDQMKLGIYFIEIDGVITQKVIKIR